MPRAKTYGRSKSGVELTESELNRMAAEAEAGFDLAGLRRRPGRPSMGVLPAETLPVRIEPELRSELNKRAAADGTTVSEIVRSALRAYLKRAG